MTCLTSRFTRPALILYGGTDEDPLGRNEQYWPDSMYRYVEQADRLRNSPAILRA